MLVPMAPHTVLLGICSAWRQQGLGAATFTDGSWLGHIKGLF